MDLKIDLSFLDDADEIAKKMEEAIKSDAEFMEKYVNPLQLSEEQFKEYVSVFDKMRNERKNCANCPGLSKCSNDVVGMLTHVKKDGDVIFRVFEQCSKSKTANRMEEAFIYRQYDKKSHEKLTLEKMKKYDELDIRAHGLRVQLSNKIKKHNTKWIYIYGDKKSGKSQFASAYANDYAKKGLGTIAYISYVELLKYATEVQYKDKKSYEQLFQELCDVSLLVLDGFGEGYMTKNVAETMIIPLLQYRLEKEKETMILTKYTTSELLDLLSNSTRAGKLIWSPILESIRNQCLRENGKKYIFKLNALVI